MGGNVEKMIMDKMSAIYENMAAITNMANLAGIQVYSPFDPLRPLWESDVLLEP